MSAPFIGIDTDELHSCDRIFNHTVNGIVSGTANANYYDPCTGFGFIRHNL